MADEADRSDEKIFNVIDDGVAEARRKIGKSLLPIGVCHFCEAALRSGLTFCDNDCRDDWEHERARKKALGL